MGLDKISIVSENIPPQQITIDNDLLALIWQKAIGWTGIRWNPITGCTKYSQGCLNCYMFREARRLRSMGIMLVIKEFIKKYFPTADVKKRMKSVRDMMAPKYAEKDVFHAVRFYFSNHADEVIEALVNTKYWYGPDTVRLHPDELKKPLTWKKSDLVFVCSMSDIFHQDVPDDFIDQIFEVIMLTPHMVYQILTKRSKRMKEYFKTRVVPKNVWIGVSLESQEYISRVDDISNIDSSVKFLSCEPLIGSIDLTSKLSSIDWVIVGGESGPHNKIRKMELNWAEYIRVACEQSKTPYYFKQTGSLQPCTEKEHKCGNKGCILLQGKLYHNFPVITK